LVHRTLVVALALSLSGCWFEKQVPKMTVDSRMGGMIQLDACGYAVTTRAGASAPVTGTPVLGIDPTPRDIHLGLASDPKTSMVVVWATNDDTLESTVQFGVNGQTDQTLEGITFDYAVPTQAPVRIHQAHLCGLTADTEYTYRVGSFTGSFDAGGATNDAGVPIATMSDTSTFRTGPSDPDAQITVLALGDTRDGYTTWASILQQAFMMERPDLILFSGDGVTLGPVQPEWETWFTLAEPYLRQVPLLPAQGNHDVNAVNYYSQFAAPGNEEDYSTDYGPLHVTVANDTPVDPTTVASTIAQFLQTDLTAAQGDPWIIVMHHRPLYSSSAGHGSDPALQMEWGPIFDMTHPDLVMNGHDHDYERSKPLHNGMVETSNADGTVYVVAGSAGAELYDSGTSFFTQYSEKTSSFVIMHIRKGLLQYNAYRQDGSALDSFMITK
jgi:hypothetical protein